MQTYTIQVLFVKLSVTERLIYFGFIPGSATSYELPQLLISADPNGDGREMHSGLVSLLDSLGCREPNPRALGQKPEAIERGERTVLLVEDWRNPEQMPTKQMRWVPASSLENLTFQGLLTNTEDMETITMYCQELPERIKKYIQERN